MANAGTFSCWMVLGLLLAMFSVGEITSGLIVAISTGLDFSTSIISSFSDSSPSHDIGRWPFVFLTLHVAVFSMFDSSSSLSELSELSSILGIVIRTLLLSIGACSLTFPASLGQLMLVTDTFVFDIVAIWIRTRIRINSRLLNNQKLLLFINYARLDKIFPFIGRSKNSKHHHVMMQHIKHQHRLNGRKRFNLQAKRFRFQIHFVPWHLCTKTTSRALVCGSRMDSVV